MPNAILLAVPSAGVADEAIRGSMGLIPVTIIISVIVGIGRAEGGRDERAGGIDRAAYDASCNVGWPEASA